MVKTQSIGTQTAMNEKPKRAYRRRTATIDASDVMRVGQVVRALVRRNRSLERQLARVRKVVG